MESQKLKELRIKYNQALKEEVTQVIENMDSEEFIKAVNECIRENLEYFGFYDEQYFDADFLQRSFINSMDKFDSVMKNWEPLDIAYAIAKGASHVGTCDIADAKYFFIHNSAIYTFKTLTAKTIKKHVSDIVNHVLEGNDLGSQKLNAIIELNKVC